MRRRARVDTNQSDIVATLRACGCSVQVLSGVGSGCPDLLAGIHGKNYLLEVKDGNKPPSARELTPDEKDWHLRWRGQAQIVNSAQEALVAVGLQPPPSGPV